MKSWNQQAHIALLANEYEKIVDFIEGKLSRSY